MVRVDATPAEPVMVMVTVSWATTGEAVKVFVRVEAEAPEPTVT